MVTTLKFREWSQHFNLDNTDSYNSEFQFKCWTNFSFSSRTLSVSVVITFLHHNEVNIPWYADSEWDFVRGQLSTIDRHYGYVHDIIHNIGVCHALDYGSTWFHMDRIC